MLADSLSGSVDLVEGLGQFEHERLPIAARAVRQGRELGAYMLEQRGPKDEIETEHWREFHSTHGILNAYRVVRAPLLQPQLAGGLHGVLAMLMSATLTEQAWSPMSPHRWML